MTETRDIGAMRLLATGDPYLDQILGGGLHERSVTVIAGEPGSGKTIFCLQFLFHLAQQGKRTVYFTTLSEPALKLIRNMQAFTFFDERLIQDRITFVDLGSTLRTKDIQGSDVMQAIAARVEELDPDLVVIDSFKAIHDFLGTTKESRAFVYDLAVQTAAWGAATLLVGEYSQEEIVREAEFAIADGILRFSNRRYELTTVRELEVLKLRGANHMSGVHFFEIGASGLTIYPRVRGPEIGNEPAYSPRDRTGSGIPGLDELLDGGFPRLSSTLIQGGSGTGKTVIGLSYLVEGARRGERGLFFTLEETPNQLRDVARNFGWDLETLERQGLLQIHYVSPIELSTDRFLHRVRQSIMDWGARRLVLDSVSSAALGVVSERRFHEFVYAFAKHCRAGGVSLLMTMEITEMFGAAQLTGHGVSSMADNIVLLRYVEVEGHIERAISVLKARGVHHGMDIRHLTIEASGITVGSPYTSMRGVLTGVPTAVSDAAEGPKPRRDG